MFWWLFFEIGGGGGGFGLSGEGEGVFGEGLSEEGNESPVIHMNLININIHFC